jgi:hypothetical protein
VKASKRASLQINSILDIEVPDKTEWALASMDIHQIFLGFRTVRHTFKGPETLLLDKAECKSKLSHYLAL